jgi:hypothetical protein
MKRNVRSVAIIVVGCILFHGCGDGRPPRVPVSGRVTIDGRPVTSGAIRFIPMGGRPSTGEIDSEGRFALSTFDPGDGCTLGTHTVTVQSMDEIDGETRRWNTPKKYASEKTSKLVESVSEATDSLQLQLTWGDERGPIIEKIYGE